MSLFLENEYKKVKWISVIDSGKEWENIWIFALTHWNEPVWIDIFNYLVNNFKISEKIKKWKIFFVSVNIMAYKNYLKNKDIEKNRFIDHNMNRISNKKFENYSYEFNRLKDLKGVFSEIDIAIDLHSVSKWDDVIWITDIKYLEESKKIFDVENILVDDIWNTGAIIWDFIKTGKEAYWIECWNHLWKIAFNNWKNNVLNLLKSKWFIDWELIKSINLENVLEFSEEVLPKSDNFRFTKDYYWFTQIKNTEIYAIDDWKNIYNWLGDNIYLWLVSSKPMQWDWAWFLFKKLD